MSEAKSFRKQVLNLLGETYGDKTLVLCPTVFVRLLGGDHKAAILLSQILYWSDKTKDPDGWFYKSYADWQTETGLSEAQVRRIVNGDRRVQAVQLTLRDLGVETLLRKVRHTGAPTLHYRINQSVFLSHLDAAIGQGDPQQCAGSTPDIARDEPTPLSGMNPEQSAASSDPEISAQTSSEETPSESSDDDLDIFRAYEDRFGKLKDRLEETFSSELNRLGADRVGQVLERCASRGRSWHYVLKALSNEVTPDQMPEPVVQTRWDGSEALLCGDGSTSPQTPENTPVPISERVQTPWQRGLTLGATIADAWQTAYGQLELQLDRATFNAYCRVAILVDYELETNTFIIAVRSAAARDTLNLRLNRSIQRILSDVSGQPATARYVVVDEWQTQAMNVA